jgi:sugar phosphate isomerase/epimerase
MGQTHLPKRLGDQAVKTGLIFEQNYLITQQNLTRGDMKTNQSGLSRRSFVKELAVSSGALMLTDAAGRLLAQNGPDWKNQIGLELFTVRDLLRKDYEGVLAKLSNIGYKQVEPADPYNNMEPQAYKALLDKYGLKMFSTHAGASDGPNLEKELEGQALMGIKYTEVRSGRGPGGRGPRGPGGPSGPNGPGAGASAAGPPPQGGPGGPPGQGGPPRAGGPSGRREPQSVESVKTSCAQLNKYGAIVKKFGMKILVHNHTGEFELLDDGKTTQYDIILKETDPELVAMQLDIGWACIAGQDPIAMFKKDPGRYELWHVKDAKYKQLDAKLSPGQRQRRAEIVTLGEGDVDYKAIFANAAIAGLKFFAIEQDTAGQGGRDAIEDCRIAFDNLAKILS